MRFDKRPTRLVLLLAGLATIAFAVTLFDMFSGGVGWQVAGVRISTRDPARPFLIALVTAATALALYDRARGSSATLEIERHAGEIAVAIAALSVAEAIHFGIFVAGGADGYGYVSQARLWLNGHLHQLEPLTTVTPSLGEAVAPLGYRLGLEPGSIVPIYPPGLPLLMALFALVAGPTAVYYVVPLAAGLVVWLTYRLGTSIDRPLTGVIAAAWMACSPIFLLQSVEPMSDVPVTAAWLAALAAALARGSIAPVLSGGAVAAALLIRPNLAPLALAIALLIWRHGATLRRTALFALPSVAVVVAIAALNQRLYGSPLASGYGPLGAIFGLQNVMANVQRYPAWLFELHTPLVVVGCLAIFTIAKRQVVGILLLYAALLTGCYIFYTPFDHWPFVRFLLPALPILFVFMASAVRSLVQRGPECLRAPFALVVCGVVASVYLQRAQSHGAFAIAASEQRYVRSGEYLGRALPERAVVVTVIESGSLRWYGNRSTLRWDLVEPSDFDAAIARLQANGYEPYILLEGHEEVAFHERFGATSKYARLDWPPSFASRASGVRVWSIRDRERSMRGEVIAVGVIP